VESVLRNVLLLTCTTRGVTNHKLSPTSTSSTVHEVADQKNIESA
jgi:hypothetical protein